MKIKASVSVIGFFEVELDVSEGVDPDVVGAQARALASTLPIKMEVEGDLPPGCRVSVLEEDDVREHIDWGEVTDD